MNFWLDKVVRRSGLPYPIFFGLIALLVYLLGIPFMIATGNLHFFLSEPRWILIAIYGAICGIPVIFVYRKFSDSLNEIKHLLGSEDEFQKTKDKLLGHLTKKFYWIIVVWWLLLNFLWFTELVQSMSWWHYYHHTNLVSTYYYIEFFPVMLFSGILLYMIPVGLNLAYRELCLKTSLNEEAFVFEWMKPFKGFKNLITLTMIAGVVYSIFPLIIWSPTFQTSAFMYVPYTNATLVLVPTILFPHYFFNKLFSKIKEKRLDKFRRDLLQIPAQKEKDILKRTLLLLEEGRVEKMKTWLIDVRTLGEILIIALMHVSLVEVLTTFMHS